MGSIQLEKIGQRHIELAYLAGFFDGEGCVLYDRIYADNTNPHILEMFFVLWPGGRVYLKTPPGEPNRSQYRWVAHGPTAREALRDMMPYLIEKKEQAEIHLDVLNHPASSDSRREQLLKLKELKRVPYDGYTQPSGTSEYRLDDKGVTEAT